MAGWRSSRAAAFLVIVWSLGCPGYAPIAGAVEGRVQEGTWGGDHAQLVVTAESASVEFDCAHGSLEPLDLDADGHFDVNGVYTREGPGPIHLPDPEDEPARYFGSLEDGELTFSVRLMEGGETVGPYTVSLGRRGRLRKCL